MVTIGLTANDIETALRAAGARTTGLVASTAEIADLFNEAILEHGGGLFDTPEKVAALLSECMMESAYFRTTEEYNTKDGDYQPFRGRTFIQITWKRNYKAFGEWCFAQNPRLVSDPNYFVDNPGKLALLSWAAIGAVWYFTQVKFYGKPLVDYSDDIIAVGKAVNLGDPRSKYKVNGEKARIASHEAVKTLGDQIVPKKPAPTEEFLPMATGKKIYIRNETDQVLPEVGTSTTLKINAKGDVSVVSGVTQAVDLTATIQATGKVRAYWRIYSVKSGTPPQVHSTRLAVRVDQEGQVGYADSVNESPIKDRQLRLRLDVEALEPGVVVTDLLIAGWVLK